MGSVNDSVNDSVKDSVSSVKDSARSSNLQEDQASASTATLRRPQDVERITRPVLTRYERASIIGLRMEQLQRGAKPFIDALNDGVRGIRSIALEELEQRRLPFVVVRKLPDGRKEHWSLHELLG